MVENCCGQVEAGRSVCELHNEGFERIDFAEVDCPECGNKGKPVNTITVKALISSSLRLVDGDDYRFCKDVECSLVYFSVTGGRNFSVEDLRVPVYQKAPDQPDIQVCYCFDHTVGEITLAATVQRDDIIGDINAGIKARQCACDIRNPQGSCCLGNVRGLVGQLSEGVRSPV